MKWHAVTRDGSRWYPYIREGRLWMHHEESETEMGDATMDELVTIVGPVLILTRV